jgi:hypothetical protein
MTMSLVRGMTSLNTKKAKATKMTAGRLEKLQKDHREHNKHMKRIHAHSNVMTFDEYVEYVSGNFKPKTTTKSKEWTYELPMRDTKHYPSVGDGVGVGLVKEALRYTGERRLVGIATMHKSNMVPVFADDDDKDGSRQATEIAQMRRN